MTTGHADRPADQVVTSRGAARLAMAAPGLARSGRRRLTALIGMLVLLALVVIGSLLLGWSWVAPGTVWDSVAHFDGSHEHLVIRESRIQRTFAAAVVGAALGLAGAVMQVLTRNPLADPGLLGVSAGAGFAVTVAVFFLGGMTMSRFVWFSLAGAFVATVVVYVVGGGGRHETDPVRATLAGVAVGAALVGLSDAMTVLDPDKFHGVRFWGVGSVVNLEISDVLTVLPFVIVGAVLALLLAGPLNALALGETQARALGLNVHLTRLGSIVAVTLLAGAATALVGMISFVGLVVPHLVRWYIGPDQRWLFPMTMVVSAILVIVADTCGRFVLDAAEMPVSIVMAGLGSPVLILLARRPGASEL